MSVTFTGKTESDFLGFLTANATPHLSCNGGRRFGCYRFKALVQIAKDNSFGSDAVKEKLHELNSAGDALPKKFGCWKFLVELALLISRWIGNLFKKIDHKANINSLRSAPIVLESASNKDLKNAEPILEPTEEPKPALISPTRAKPISASSLHIAPAMKVTHQVAQISLSTEIQPINSSVNVVVLPLATPATPIHSGVSVPSLPIVETAPPPVLPTSTEIPTATPSVTATVTISPEDVSPPVVCSTTEILTAAIIKGRFDQAETELLFSQECLDISDWNLERIIWIHPDQSFNCGMRLLEYCKNLKKVIVRDEKNKYSTKKSWLFFEIIDSERLNKVQIELPPLHLRGNLSATKKYWKQHVLTPEFRREVCRINFPLLEKDDILKNLFDCLKTLSTDHPEEVITLIIENCAHLLAADQTLKEECSPLLKTLVSPVRVGLCRKLLENTETQKYFVAFSSLLELIPNLSPKDKPTPTEYRLKTLLTTAKETGVAEYLFNIIKRTRSHKDTRQFLDEMDSATFGKFLGFYLTLETQAPEFFALINAIPVQKLGQVMAHLEVLNKVEYANCSETIFTKAICRRSAPTPFGQFHLSECMALGKIAAHSFLSILQSSKKTNQKKRFSNLFGRLDIEITRTEFAKALGLLCTIENCETIFEILRKRTGFDITLVLSQIIKTVIQSKNEQLIIIAFKCVWNLEERFHLLANAELTNLFTEIPNAVILGKLLNLIKGFATSTAFEMTARTQWYDSLLMVRNVPNPSIPNVFDTFKPKVKDEEILDLLAVHSDLLPAISPKLLREFFERLYPAMPLFPKPMRPEHFTYEAWLTQLAEVGPWIREDHADSGLLPRDVRGIVSEYFGFPAPKKAIEGDIIDAGPF